MTDDNDAWAAHWTQLDKSLGRMEEHVAGLDLERSDRLARLHHDVQRARKYLTRIRKRTTFDDGTLLMRAAWRKGFREAVKIMGPKWFAEWEEREGEVGMYLRAYMDAELRSAKVLDDLDHPERDAVKIIGVGPDAEMAE